MTHDEYFPESDLLPGQNRFSQVIFPNYHIKKNYDTLSSDKRTRRGMFVPRGLEAGGDAAAQQVEERLRAQRETRNDALRFLLIPVVLELGAHFCTFVLGWDWICT
ncbi:unnamed protein product [Onchocerca flexuosa]|uniref:Transmembrane protein n=1 Tax=Onchocerca flexuosa TaxID=387005 RepID=A0A183I0P3_9BILA|nr:unnamed protein product [Onchocerca flexuosa]